MHNYDAEANTDNGCEVPGEPCDDGDESTIFDVVGEDCMCAGVLAVPGCTDDDACNYNMDANVDDESCVYMGRCHFRPLFPDEGDVSVHYNGAVGTTFTWSVVGGEVTAGQGTTSIEVTWGTDGIRQRHCWKATGRLRRQVVRTVTILATSNMNEAAMGAVSFPNPAREAFRVGLRPIPARVDVLFDILVPK